MVAKSDVKNVVSRFIDECLKNGIPIQQAILFGSYVKGAPDRNSDIDVALVSPSFGKNIFENSDQTALINFQFADIEVHHFSPEEFNQDLPFINEIKRTGIRIY